MHEVMAIGRFARLSGLSVGALRHYDEVGLLRPADVDGDAGYRRYRPAHWSGRSGASSAPPTSSSDSSKERTT